MHLSRDSDNFCLNIFYTIKINSILAIDLNPCLINLPFSFILSICYKESSLLKCLYMNESGFLFPY